MATRRFSISVLIVASVISAGALAQQGVSPEPPEKLPYAVETAVSSPDAARPRSAVENAADSGTNGDVLMLPQPAPFDRTGGAHSRECADVQCGRETRGQ